MVERFFRDLTDKRLLRGVFCDVEAKSSATLVRLNRILVVSLGGKTVSVRWERG